MIENPEAAKSISQTLLNINGQLDESIRKIEAQVTPDEFKAYKRGVGYVLYEIFERLLEPLYERHPSLKPPNLEE